MRHVVRNAQAEFLTALADQVWIAWQTAWQRAVEDCLRYEAGQVGRCLVNRSIAALAAANRSAEFFGIKWIGWFLAQPADVRDKVVFIGNLASLPMVARVSRS